ncbi:unnamed protein product, partial [Meganyctiphanes norvegica]
MSNICEMIEHHHKHIQYKNLKMLVFQILCHKPELFFPSSNNWKLLTPHLKDPQNEFYQAVFQLLKNFPEIFSEFSKENCTDVEQQNLMNIEKNNFDFIEWRLIILNTQPNVLEHAIVIQNAQSNINDHASHLDEAPAIGRASSENILGEFVDLQNIKKETVDLSLIKEESSEVLNVVSEYEDLSLTSLVNEDVLHENREHSLQEGVLEDREIENSLHEHQKRIFENKAPIAHNTDLKHELREHFVPANLNILNRNNPCYSTTYLIFQAIIKSKRRKLKEHHIITWIKFCYPYYEKVKNLSTKVKDELMSNPAFTEKREGENKYWIIC